MMFTRERRHLTDHDRGPRDELKVKMPKKKPSAPRRPPVAIVARVRPLGGNYGRGGGGVGVGTPVSSLDGSGSGGSATPPEQPGNVGAVVGAGPGLLDPPILVTPDYTEVHGRRFHDLDDVLDEFATQQDLYDKVGKPCLEHLLEVDHHLHDDQSAAPGSCSSSTLTTTTKNYTSSRSACVLACGATGTGKTHCIVGDLWRHELEVELLEGRGTDVDQKLFSRGREADIKFADLGVMPRVCYEVLENVFSDSEAKVLEQSSATLSCCELYNGHIRDLVQNQYNPPNALSIRVASGNGPFVEGLSERQVGSGLECLQLLKDATERRAQVPTSLNPSSSRSHLICTLKVECSSSKTASSCSRRHMIVVQFVDLAGREQLGEEHGFCNQLKCERNHINTSLYHLSHYLSGSGISTFRDTKLTMLLSATLANVQTKRFVIAALSPLQKHEAENLATLRFCRNLSLKVLKLGPKGGGASTSTASSCRGTRSRANRTRARAAERAGSGPAFVSRSAATERQENSTEAAPADLGTADPKTKEFQRPSVEKNQIGAVRPRKLRGFEQPTLSSEPKRREPRRSASAQSQRSTRSVETATGRGRGGLMPPRQPRTLQRDVVFEPRVSSPPSSSGNRRIKEHQQEQEQAAQLEREVLGSATAHQERQAEPASGRELQLQQAKPKLTASAHQQVALPPKPTAPAVHLQRQASLSAIARSKLLSAVLEHAEAERSGEEVSSGMRTPPRPFQIAGLRIPETHQTSAPAVAPKSLPGSHSTTAPRPHQVQVHELSPIAPTIKVSPPVVRAAPIDVVQDQSCAHLQVEQCDVVDQHHLHNLSTASGFSSTPSPSSCIEQRHSGSTASKKKHSSSSRRLQELDRCFALQIQRLRDALLDAHEHSEKKLLESQIVFLKNVRHDYMESRDRRTPSLSASVERRASLRHIKGDYMSEKRWKTAASSVGSSHDGTPVARRLNFCASAADVQAAGGGERAAQERERDREEPQAPAVAAGPRRSFLHLNSRSSSTPGSSSDGRNMRVIYEPPPRIISTSTSITAPAAAGGPGASSIPPAPGTADGQPAKKLPPAPTTQPAARTSLQTTPTFGCSSMEASARRFSVVSSTPPPRGCGGNDGAPLLHIPSSTGKESGQRVQHPLLCRNGSCLQLGAKVKESFEALLDRNASQGVLRFNHNRASTPMLDRGCGGPSFQLQHGTASTSGLKIAAGPRGTGLVGGASGPVFGSSRPQHNLGTRSDTPLEKRSLTGVVASAGSGGPRAITPTLVPAPPPPPQRQEVARRTSLTPVRQRGFVLEAPVCVKLFPALVSGGGSSATISCTTSSGLPPDAGRHHHQLLNVNNQTAGLSSGAQTTHGAKIAGFRFDSRVRMCQSVLGGRRPLVPQLQLPSKAYEYRCKEKPAAAEAPVSAPPAPLAAHAAPQAAAPSSMAAPSSKDVEAGPRKMWCSSEEVGEEETGGSFVVPMGFCSETAPQNQTSETPPQNQTSQRSEKSTIRNGL